MRELENELSQQELMVFNDYILNNTDNILKEIETIINSALDIIRNNTNIGISTSLQIHLCKRKVQYIKSVIEEYKPEYLDKVLKLEHEIDLIIRDKLEVKSFKVKILLKRTTPSFKTCTFYKTVDAQNVDMAIIKVRTMIKDFMMDDNIIIELKAEEE